MFRKTTLYAQTLVLLIAVAVVVHYLTGIDWPWAIVAGAAVSLVARALIPVAARALSRGVGHHDARLRRQRRPRRTSSGRRTTRPG